MIQKNTIMESIDKNEFLESMKELLELGTEENLRLETQLTEIEEWDSLVALSFMALVKEKYDLQLGGHDIRNAETIQDFYDLLVLSRRDIP